MELTEYWRAIAVPVDDAPSPEWEVSFVPLESTKITVETKETVDGVEWGVLDALLPAGEYVIISVESSDAS